MINKIRLNCCKWGNEWTRIGVSDKWLITKACPMWTGIVVGEVVEMLPTKIEGFLKDERFPYVEVAGVPLSEEDAEARRRRR